MPSAPRQPPLDPSSEDSSYDSAAADAASLVVRRYQPLPEGEEDSRGSDPHASPRPSWSPWSNKGPRSRDDNQMASPRRRDPEQDASMNGEEASLAELTAYSENPHHKHQRRGKHSDPERQGARRHSAESDDEHERRLYQESKRRESGRRRRRRHRRDETDDEESSLLGDHDRHRSSSRHRSPHRHSRRRGSFSLSNAIRTFNSFFDGINLKTVLLCMLGMTMIVKLHRPPHPPNADGGMGMGGGQGMEHPSREMAQGVEGVAPGVRGAAAALNLVDDSKDEEGSDGGGEEATAASKPKAEKDDEAKDEQDTPLAVSAQAVEQGSPWQQSQLGQQAMPGHLTMQTPMGAANQATMQQFAPQPMQMGQSMQAMPMQQQGMMNQMSMQPQMNPMPVQPGYYAAPQQPMPLSANAMGMGAAMEMAQPGAVSPLAWQQSQMAGQAEPAVAAPGVPVQTADAAPAVPVQTAEVAADAVAPPAEAQPSEGATASDEAAAEVPPTKTATAEEVSVAADADSAADAPAPAPGSVLRELSNFADTWDPYDKTATPMFWHIPKAGGSSIKDAIGGCHRFVQATEFGVTDGHIDDTEVAIVYPAVPGVADTDRSPFVNIDSTTVEGIQRAKSMGFADAQLAQVVVSPFVFETNDLFTQTAKGRLFSVFRHPIDRAVSMFYYIRVADWEPSYKPELQEWTLDQYATSDIVENNWMTRQLSNQLGGELTEENLQRAMEVVRTKFIVGLMSKIEPSMVRFEKFFRWTYRVNPPNQEACRERLMTGGANSNKKNKKPLEEGDPAWDLLAQQNIFDLQLYAYIEQLFEEQEQFVEGMPDDFRNVDGTCCKCDPPTFPPEGFTCPQAVKNEG
ncbi:hypothetical protein ACHAXT_013247 [Thalassiosira profunda]